MEATILKPSEHLALADHNFPADAVVRDAVWGVEELERLGPAETEPPSQLLRRAEISAVVIRFQRDLLRAGLKIVLSCSRLETTIGALTI